MIFSTISKSINQPRWIIVRTCWVGGFARTPNLLGRRGAGGGGTTLGATGAGWRGPTFTGSWRKLAIMFNALQR